MKVFWRYTLARLAILAVTYAVILGVGLLFFSLDTLTNLLALLAAMIISSVISIFALAGMRNDLAAHVQARAERMSERIEESRRAEDVD